MTKCVQIVISKIYGALINLLEAPNKFIRTVDNIYKNVYVNPYIYKVSRKIQTYP